MGVPEIKYGDSVCFVMHVATGLWLSYQAPDAKSSRLGPLKRRVNTIRRILHFTESFKKLTKPKKITILSLHVLTIYSKIISFIRAYRRLIRFKRWNCLWNQPLHCCIVSQIPLVSGIHLPMCLMLEPECLP